MAAERAPVPDAFPPIDPFVAPAPGRDLATGDDATGVDRLTSAARRHFGRRAGSLSRLGGGAMLAIVGLLGLLVIAATDQIVPASSAHQAQLRIWLVSRAAGIVTLVLLAVQVASGLVLSHPTNKLTWRLSRAVFPWHDTLWLFVLAFVATHIVAIVLDPYAGVGLAGAVVPGLSSYRSGPVALGAIAFEALLVTGITARWTRLLPPGAWLVVHRAGSAIFVLGWMHGLLAGTDSAAITWLYVALAVFLGAAVAHRMWAPTASDVARSAADVSSEVQARVGVR